MLGPILILLSGLLLAPQPAPQFFKGNTHTHTLWSDGNAAPELPTDWYRSNGYHFLVLSDHNILSQGERWFPVSEGAQSRLTAERVAELRQRFGAHSVETRERDGKQELRLLTLSELKRRFERKGEFLLVQGEEVTDRYDPRQPGARALEIHVNGINTSELIKPQGGGSAVEVMNRNVEAVIADGRKAGKPVLAHINHPNFGWSLTWRDVAAVSADRFFEVYNGHRSVHNRGDATRASMDQLWDRALTLRLTELDLGLLYGLATDDSHHYHGKQKTAVPGRGFVMVRAESLSEDLIVRAMKRGDFYASTGVVLADFSSDGATYRIDLAPREGEQLTVRFVGTRGGDHGDQTVGAVLMETTENPAVYRFQGDELYVRAVVVSSIPHPDPAESGDPQSAWLQPVIPAR